jgi:hypothetical protein
LLVASRLETESVQTVVSGSSKINLTAVVSVFASVLHEPPDSATPVGHFGWQMYDPVHRYVGVCPSLQDVQNATRYPISSAVT